MRFQESVKWALIEGVPKGARKARMDESAAVNALLGGL
jgi:hypothetical protein